MAGIKKLFFLVLYYCFAKYLPTSSSAICNMGIAAKKLRYRICRDLFKECGKNVNIERNADFGSGENIRIGNDSGLGCDCRIEGPVIIGSDVRMGPKVTIFRQNHNFFRTDISIGSQGVSNQIPLKICDGVWVSFGVIILPSCRRIGKGAIIGAGAVVTKDVPDYSIFGGNPARLLKMRTLTHDPTGENKLTLPSGVIE